MTIYSPLLQEPVQYLPAHVLISTGSGVAPKKNSLAESIFSSDSVSISSISHKELLELFDL